MAYFYNLNLQGYQVGKVGDKPKIYTWLGDNAKWGNQVFDMPFPIDSTYRKCDVVIA